jgi:hypothetical protein
VLTGTHTVRMSQPNNAMLFIVMQFRTMIGPAWSMIAFTCGVDIGCLLA